MRNKLVSGLAGAVFSFAAVLCAGVGLLTFCPNASATEGFSGFGHLTTPAEQPPISRAKPVVRAKKPAKLKKQPRVNEPAEPWGPVPTEKTSIANLAPVLLPFPNGRRWGNFIFPYHVALAASDCSI